MTSTNYCKNCGRLKEYYLPYCNDCMEMLHDMDWGGLQYANKRKKIRN
jgi:hypothetical protein